MLCSTVSWHYRDKTGGNDWCSKLDRLWVATNYSYGWHKNAATGQHLASPCTRIICHLILAWAHTRIREKQEENSSAGSRAETGELRRINLVKLQYGPSSHQIHQTDECNENLRISTLNRSSWCAVGKKTGNGTRGAKSLQSHVVEFKVTGKRGRGSNSRTGYLTPPRTRPQEGHAGECLSALTPLF